MRRRSAFTLVELLVVMAIVLIIMVILSRAFGDSLATLRQAKGIGDLQERLRSATSILHRDLSASHFDGGRRVSDPLRFGVQGPRQGFFRIVPEAFQSTTTPPSLAYSAGTTLEGTDDIGIPSFRVTQRALHFSVRLRGNEPQFVFSAKVPPGSPLLTASTTYFNLPADCRFQDSSPTNDTLNSQWAEVYYSLRANGSQAGNTRLYGLYRSQYVLVTDNSKVNGAVPDNAQTRQDYGEVSFSADTKQGGFLHFNTPEEATAGTHSALAGSGSGGTLLISDVVSFEVSGWTRAQWNPWTNNPSTGQYYYWDYVQYDSGAPRYTLDGIRITLRVWNRSTLQTRQISIWQDM